MFHSETVNYLLQFYSERIVMTWILDAESKVYRTNYSFLDDWDYLYSSSESIIQHSRFYHLFFLDLKSHNWYFSQTVGLSWSSETSEFLNLKAICFVPYRQVYFQRSRRLIRTNSNGQYNPQIQCWLTMTYLEKFFNILHETNCQEII